MTTQAYPKLFSTFFYYFRGHGYIYDTSNDAWRHECSTAVYKTTAITLCWYNKTCRQRTGLRDCKKMLTLAS